MTQNPIVAQLAATGVSVWLDDLSRERIQTGNLSELISTKGVVGVTTNPSIFQAALSNGTVYEPQLKELVSRGADTEAVIQAMTTDDVRDACDLFMPIYQSTNGFDGRVSIEVDPSWPTRPRRRSHRLRSCGRSSTGLTSSSRFLPPRLDFRRSPQPSVKASASMSR